MSNPLSLSQISCATWTSFGSECQPLLTVGNALSDPGLVVSIAQQHEYRPIGPFYPGIRAPVSAEIAMPLVAPILSELQTRFALCHLPIYHECYLSVVTCNSRDLTPIQRVPHFDGVENDRLAILLYLDRAEQGGTAFFRQRSTGFESVDADRFGPYRETLERETAQYGLPGGYIAGDTDMFEQTHRIAGVFNRMIAYRGNTLHCAALPAGFSPTADIARGRLTLNLFLRT